MATFSQATRLRRLPSSTPTSSKVFPKVFPLMLTRARFPVIEPNLSNPLSS